MHQQPVKPKCCLPTAPAPTPTATTPPIDTQHPRAPPPPITAIRIVPAATFAATNSTTAPTLATDGLPITTPTRITSSYVDAVLICSH
nr:unnamed protein product [Spirometra erinaceieuropaei]